MVSTINKHIIDNNITDTKEIKQLYLNYMMKLLTDYNLLRTLKIMM